MSYARLALRLGIAALLLLAAVSLRFAIVDAGVLTGADGSTLVPSAQPALLGAIDEVGRNGWLCRPELAAAAKHAQNAELPELSH
jgi:hypothetical protein